MARDHQDNRRIDKMPEWKRNRASCNPPAKYRRLWRQEYRAFSRQQLIREDHEDLQIPPMKKVTSIYDWY